MNDQSDSHSNSSRATESQRGRQLTISERDTRRKREGKEKESQKGKASYIRIQHCIISLNSEENEEKKSWICKVCSRVCTLYSGVMK